VPLISPYSRQILATNLKLFVLLLGVVGGVSTDSLQSKCLGGDISSLSRPSRNSTLSKNELTATPQTKQSLARGGSLETELMRVLMQRGQMR
jgi:hypothetical protein